MTEEEKLALIPVDRPLYTIEEQTRDLPVEDFLANYFDFGRYFACCQACPNFGKYWTCPPFEFDVADYWRRYHTLRAVARKYVIDPGIAQTAYSPEGLNYLMEAVTIPERHKLAGDLARMEWDTPGSRYLSAGTCDLCGYGKCSRLCGQNCARGIDLHYSIESIGGNVTAITKDLFGYDILWIKDGRLPPYFSLVGGLMIV
ncbi:MAG TPA: DUF2284 domain-containing protein [Oscillospiraceae bacterium]|nr:metal-binding protein [Oscillospiraceae bacterium]HNW04198.1 DUF2284 domain-containing protein [Oscillospiraceae bacterium]HPV99572.1 DUF2284 domain-containing protein [Oscillospiraceae bacterium]